MTRPRVLLAGAAPGEGAGNAVSSAVLLEALRGVADVTPLTHRIAPYPRLWARGDPPASVTLGVQPFAVHGEALLAGILHGRALRAWSAAWVVNSRYASAFLAAGIPYAIWEATTIRDELQASKFREVRRAGRGSGLGLALHRALLPVGERLERSAYARATLVLAMSEHTRGRIQTQHGIAGDRIQLLPHPPSRSFLEVLRRQRAVGRETTTGSELRLLFVGRVDDPRKNFALLLEAWRSLTAAGVESSLTVIGPHADAWRRTVRDLESSRLIVRGMVPAVDLARAYLDHDVLVLTSRQEGFGIVVAEAMHAGLPVVITRCGGPEDVVRRSEGGVIVDPSVDALVAALRRLAESTECRRAMGERGRSFARRELSFERFERSVASFTEYLVAQ